MIIAKILLCIAALFVALSLGCAVSLGRRGADRGARRDGGFRVATRGADEDLSNCRSLAQPSGEAGTAARPDVRRAAVPSFTGHRGFFRR